MAFPFCGSFRHKHTLSYMITDFQGTERKIALSVRSESKLAALTKCHYCCGSSATQCVVAVFLRKALTRPVLTYRGNRPFFLIGNGGEK